MVRVIITDGFTMVEKRFKRKKKVAKILAKAMPLFDDPRISWVINGKAVCNGIYDLPIGCFCEWNNDEPESSVYILGVRKCYNA